MINEHSGLYNFAYEDLEKRRRGIYLRGKKKFPGSSQISPIKNLFLESDVKWKKEEKIGDKEGRVESLSKSSSLPMLKHFKKVKISSARCDHILHGCKPLERTFRNPILSCTQNASNSISLKGNLKNPIEKCSSQASSPIPKILPKLYTLNQIDLPILDKIKGIKYFKDHL
ncbi:unnamed protein product [Blepharisma stoltei]|uniref:Uncharacterized protein n=1 Tax=Blepharisma stoltei TaxID=1481888 RepID=A0AAU9IMH3_9CILI|nr:unnamed protein product [Blepharisma stoltei]